MPDSSSIRVRPLLSSKSEGLPAKTPPDESGLLNSWKEISAYMKRGVRTVQRWEAEYGLPVRRPSGHAKGSVFALRRELDNWTAATLLRNGESSLDPRLTRVKEITAWLLEHSDTSVEILRAKLEEIQALMEDVSSIGQSQR